MTAARPGGVQRTLRFDHLWTPAGWLTPGLLVLDAEGRVVSAGRALEPGQTAHESWRGLAVPGMPNTHSHAFQRALAGRTEAGSPESEDNLWTWRRAMYRLAERIGPEELQAIAAFAYMEMLEHGFTRVAEFHYLHHAPGGRPYAEPGEMSLRLAAAARDCGIGLMVLPTLYAHAGIGLPPTEQQLRFVHREASAFARLLESLEQPLAAAGAQLGVALHSLRAVAPDELREALAAGAGLRRSAPLHIHVSETRHEVAEVEAGLGARPVQWLLDQVGLDRRWTLVHATHLSESERSGLAASGAVASLCPMTEAMLGDGLFPLPAYQREGGIWAIGTDSHYASGVAAELRMLECGQRLAHGRRNVLADPTNPDARARRSGERLFALALAGSRSFGEFGAALAPGSRADLVVLDADSPALVGHDATTALDAWLLSGAADAVQHVMCAGAWVVRDGRHVARETITRAYAGALRKLFD
ncbi:MAG: formimidoylglutamate deiminase [Rubrivivax sp.]